MFPTSKLSRWVFCRKEPSTVLLAVHVLCQTLWLHTRIAMWVLSLSTHCVWCFATTCGHARKKCERGTSSRGTLILSTFEVIYYEAWTSHPKNMDRIPRWYQSFIEVSGQITWSLFLTVRPSHDVWRFHPDSNTPRHQSKIGAWWSGCGRGWRWVGISTSDYIKGVIYI